MTTRFVSGSSPVYEYVDIPMHPAGACDGHCAICEMQEEQRMNGTAKIIGACTWSGTESHSTLRRSFWDVLFGRPGKWIPD